MERLTRRSANGTGVYATPSGEPIEWENNRHNVLQKLADYEDLEEQGRLIKLPCKVGDTVWDNDFGRPCAYTITAFSFGECEEYICEPVTTKKAVFYYANSRNMPDKELAEFIHKMEATCFADIIGYANKDCGQGKISCRECRAKAPTILEWLQSEAE